jgi:UDP-N-acetylmuramoylalanine--D-glutamate ligase
MLAAILQAGGQRCWLGGNIGHSLLAELPQMQVGDVVVLELSSFQLYWLSDKARWPTAAVVTNCLPNHLDWHSTWEDYVAAKQKLISHLPADGIVVLSELDLEVSRWPAHCHHVSSDSQSLQTLPALRVPGKHNRINAACAAAMASQLGVDPQAISSALADFAGLPHRLRFVTEVAGRDFYNDSKSTTPAATIAALNVMEHPTWLLLGGADKQSEWGEFVKTVLPQVKGVAVFGDAGKKLYELFGRINNAAEVDRKPLSSFHCNTMQQALHWCWKNSVAGDAILLSPACPSTDQFRDFAHRGEEFERCVRSLQHE